MIELEKKFQKIDLTVFPKEREIALKNICRYSMFDVFFYRSNLWVHNNRVLWILEEIIPIAKKYFKFDVEKARILALVHDDAEIITGDIQAGHKALMSKKELAEIAKDERQAVDELVKIYPKTVHGYSYKHLLMHSLKKDCIEAQLVSYADKIDAYCESTHELLAGNITAIRSVMFYTKVRLEFPKKFPQLAQFLLNKESYFIDTESRSLLQVKPKNYKGLNKPFTKETIRTKTDLLFYNSWKNVVIKKGGKEGLNYLITQKEFLKK